MDAKQPPLIGSSRIRLVDGLLALVDQVQQTGETRWVSLEAPSGWGKTRVAQALYERLAARQSQRYWPATILEATAAAHSDDITDRRKRVYPEWDKLDRAAGSLPDFFWWGLSGADYKNGAASSILRKDIEQQIERHAVYLELAWAALDRLDHGAFPTLADARRALGAVLDEVAGWGVGEALEQFAGWGLPGSGLLVRLARGRVDKARADAERRAAVALAGPLPAAQPNLLDDTRDNLTRLARPGLPVLVFIEDLHWVPPLIAELLECLVRANAALLVISSTWPRELERHPRLLALPQDPIVGERCLRVLHDAPAPAPFPADAGLAELPAADMQQLVLAYYPKAEPETLRRLGARYNNPMMLELVCRQDAWRRDFPDGDLALEPQEIADLADDVAAQYKRIWDALPPRVQQALVLATLAIPDDETAWDRDLVGRAAAGCTSHPGPRRHPRHPGPRPHPPRLGARPHRVAAPLQRAGPIGDRAPGLRRPVPQAQEGCLPRPARGLHQGRRLRRRKRRDPASRAPGADAAPRRAGRHRGHRRSGRHRALLRALADQPLELPLRIRLGERALGLAVDPASTQDAGCPRRVCPCPWRVRPDRARHRRLRGAARRPDPRARPGPSRHAHDA
jgi:hypothetical protein